MDNNSNSSNNDGSSSSSNSNSSSSSSKQTNSPKIVLPFLPSSLPSRSDAAFARLMNSSVEVVFNATRLLRQIRISPTRLRQDRLYYSVYCIGLNTVFASLLPMAALLFLNVRTVSALSAMLRREEEEEEEAELGRHRGGRHRRHHHYQQQGHGGHGDDGGTDDSTGRRALAVIRRWVPNQCR